MGVLPLFAHVRLVSGCSIKPDSSMKTRLAFDSVDLFYARPFLLPPVSRCLLISLLRLLGRFLAGEPKSMKHPANMVTVVLNLESLPNHFGDSLGGPKVG
jgi:hypothetical protein